MQTIRLGSLARDTLIGSLQTDDWFQAGAGDDVMFGNGGNDLFDGGAGHDRMHGGKGADTMLGGEGNDTAYAGAGNDLVEAGEGNDKVYAGTGHDTVRGDAGDDLIEAGSGNDLVLGGSGSDEIQGEAGNDTIQGGQDNGRLVWTGGVSEDEGDSEDDDKGEGEDEDEGEDDKEDDKDEGGEECAIGATSLDFTIRATHDGSKPGNPGVAVNVTETGEGSLLFKLTVEPNGKNVADLRGLFFQIDNEDLAKTLSAKGEWVSSFKGAEDEISNLGGGVNTEGVKTGPFDFGLSFGTSGIGKDDVREASFTLFSSKGPIGLDLLENMDFAARLTSFGAEGGKRDGSLKLIGNAGEIEKSVCEAPEKAEPAAPAPAAAPAAEKAPAAPAPLTLSEVVIGDNLYGNEGRDTFIFEKGDGVDLIWDFEAGADLLDIRGYASTDVDAFTFVSKVTNLGREGVNPLDAGSHQKLALILDASGDAIIFNDLGNEASKAAAVKFTDKTMSVSELLAKAAPATTAAAAATPAGDEVSAKIAITNSWWGGFQGEIVVTAKADLTDWDILLGSKFNLNSVWGAELGGKSAAAGGTLFDLNDANWNGTLAAGQSATIGFTAETGFAGVMAAPQILESLWIG